MSQKRFSERIAVTPKAEAVIDQLREKHGELMFHQSGGCCDGSAPMCFVVYVFCSWRIHGGFARR